MKKTVIKILVLAGLFLASMHAAYNIGYKNADKKHEADTVMIMTACIAAQYLR